MQEEKGKGFCTKLLPLIVHVHNSAKLSQISYIIYHDKYHNYTTTYIIHYTDKTTYILIYIYIKLTLTCTTRAPLKKVSKEIV